MSDTITAEQRAILLGHAAGKYTAGIVAGLDITTGQHLYRRSQLFHALGAFDTTHALAIAVVRGIVTAEDLRLGGVYWAMKFTIPASSGQFRRIRRTLGEEAAATGRARTAQCYSHCVRGPGRPPPPRQLPHTPSCQPSRVLLQIDMHVKLNGQKVS